MKLAAALNFNGNEAQYMILECLATDPTVKRARIYFNTTLNKVKFYNGTTWEVLNDSAIAATPNKLALRDSNGDFAARDITVDHLIISQAPTAANHAVTKAFVEGLVDITLKQPQGYTPSSGNYPATYNGNAIQGGDTFRMASAGTMGANTVNPEDLVIALIDNPGQTDANWQIIESNRDQASETVKGVAKIATNSVMDVATNDTDFVTAKKLKYYLDSNQYTRKRAFAINGTGAAASFILTHSLNTRDVSIYVRENFGNYEEVFVDKQHTDVNNVTIKFAAAPANGENYVVVIIG